ncbi:cilia- and flagella-associated protein 251-like isoform X1 [Portunus trituberculatus]|uniref:cilia- and flagella-associated protein 251-like isoform X1 n=1 Tax=Portunus trituberculatus TaxID=210409 RepID=UPI001E1D121B|nr:cilia- and flagella-associated protein 251-like isoform X1 [Portunus trituberculatus]XP_045118921.1 cilia- and flagella-associated protein 251-like isoform X1 [Portunus trituberculatus]
MATQDAALTCLIAPQHGAGMECSRCRSRHEAHRHKIDSKPDTLRARGHGREAARVIQEGVSRWTFPSRTSSRPPLLGPPEGAAQSWSPGNSWNLQIQHSIPDMEGVVGEELRLRIERVLAFPMGRGEAEEHVPDVTSTNGHPGDARSPAGGLLQEYLDQLDPEEEGEEGMEEEEDELLFQGSESDRESEADLIYDSDKEQYTTPYLLFLQHNRIGRRDTRREPEPCPDDLQPLRHPPAREEKEDEEDGSSGRRDGAVGRSGHRSSRATSSRTPPTLASVTRELTDSKSNNRDPETSISSDRGSKTGDSAPLRNSPLPLVSLPLSKGEEVESETEDQPEEEDGKAKQKDKDEKKKRKRKKKRRKMKKTKSKGETTEEEEEEREREQEDEQRKGSNVESPEMKVESLRKSTALVLFRNFAKTVYAPRHSQFKLFSNLEDLEEVSPSTGPLSPAAKGTPRL